VPYLCGEPLAAALRQPDAALLVGDAVSLSACVPAQLLNELLAGRVDAALVSIGGILPHQELTILPDMAIASRGPVMSIQLYAKKPLDRVRTVALDSSSRSAVALTRTLFAEAWMAEPEFITRPPDLPSMLSQADAALLIGNPALRTNVRLDRGEWSSLGLERHDLGKAWDDMTGLPFVYAAWAARPGIDHERLTGVLQRAKTWGMRRLNMLAGRGARDLGLPQETADAYLHDVIRFDLGEEERAGMEHFCRLAVSHGVLPPISAVRMAEREPALR
jgi:chorismate dehydratase